MILIIYSKFKNKCNGKTELLNYPEEGYLAALHRKCSFGIFHLGSLKISTPLRGGSLLNILEYAYAHKVIKSIEL